MLRNFKIRTRLMAGFGVVVLFLVVVGIISLMNYAKQGRMMDDFYEHPFTVTNAIREADGHIIRMHRGVKDALLNHDNQQELDAALKEYRRFRKDSLRAARHCPGRVFSATRPP